RGRGIAEVAHATDEEALVFGEHDGHRVEEARPEGIAAQPVAGNVALQAEVQLFARNDVRGWGHGGSRKRRGAARMRPALTLLGAAVAWVREAGHGPGG